MTGWSRNSGNDRNRQSNGKNSNANVGSQNIQNVTMKDLFGGKHLEYVAAALLLTGRLQVDSVELFRGSPVVNVNLIGKYSTKNNNTNPLSEFLEQNGDMTIDDIFDAFKNRLDKG